MTSFDFRRFWDSARVEELEMENTDLAVNKKEQIEKTD
jgi:hypothetical protein